MKLLLVVALALFAVVHAGRVQVADINTDKVQVVDLPKQDTHVIISKLPEAIDQPSSGYEPQPCDESNPKCYQRPSIDPEYVQPDNNGFPDNLYRNN